MTVSKGRLPSDVLYAANMQYLNTNASNTNNVWKWPEILLIPQFLKKRKFLNYSIVAAVETSKYCATAVTLGGQIIPYPLNSHQPHPICSETALEHSSTIGYLFFSVPSCTSWYYQVAGVQLPGDTCFNWFMTVMTKNELIYFYIYGLTIKICNGHNRLCQGYSKIHLIVSIRTMSVFEYCLKSSHF